MDGGGGRFRILILLGSLAMIASGFLPWWRAGGQRAPVDLLEQHGSEHVRGRISREGSPAGQHFEEDDAEGPDIGAAIDRLPARLLRGHIGGRTDYRPVLCGARRECG